MAGGGRLARGPGSVGCKCRMPTVGPALGDLQRGCLWQSRPAAWARLRAAVQPGLRRRTGRRSSRGVG
eukprot:6006281-Pyramimonas_sp.AAC.1